MKRYLVFAMMVVVVASCHKTAETQPFNTWTLNGTSYKAGSVTRQTNRLWVDTAGGALSHNFLDVEFAALPVTSASYTIVDASSFKNVGATEVKIIVGTRSPLQTYFSTGREGKSLSVYVSKAGKIGISIPENVVSNGYDSFKVSASVIEQ